MENCEGKGISRGVVCLSIGVLLLAVKNAVIRVRFARVLAHPESGVL